MSMEIKSNCITCLVRIPRGVRFQSLCALVSRSAADIFVIHFIFLKSSDGCDPVIMINVHLAQTSRPWNASQLTDFKDGKKRLSIFFMPETTLINLAYAMNTHIHIYVRKYTSIVVACVFRLRWSEILQLDVLHGYPRSARKQLLHIASITAMLFLSLFSGETDAE